MIESMKRYKTKDIAPFSYFSGPVYIDDQFIFSAPEMPISVDMIKALEEWEVNEVYCKGDNTDDNRGPLFWDDDPDDPDDHSSSIKRSITRAEVFYTSFLAYARNLFVHATVGNELSFDHVAAKIKELCDHIKHDKTMLLRVQEKFKTNTDDNYLASHSVKTAIISIIIGTYFKLPAHRLIELGVAAMVHEIGMVRLPTRIYLSKGPLKALEKKAIISHPAQGYDMLKSYGFPLSIMLAALEHHERDNGSGYPRNLTSEKISLYAKIIAVVCSYEAISSKRPHREAKDGYTGMLELLRNDGKQYDDTVIRALVYSLSLYPIGLYVLLSNDWRGQVVDSNPDDPRYPVVQVFAEHNPGGINRIIQTSQEEIYITRPLSPSEVIIS